MSTKTPANSRPVFVTLGDPMVSLEDIAQHLAVSKRTVAAWRAEGLLPPADFVVSRVLRWRVSTLQRFLAEREGGKRHAD